MSDKAITGLVAVVLMFALMAFLVVLDYWENRR